MKNVEDIYPLSPLQEGILFHSISEPASGTYFEQYACKYSGDFNVERFEKAWEKTIQQHAVLRTVVIWEGIDEPLQIVHQSVNPDWQKLDWQNASKEEQAIQTDAFLSKDRVAGIDVSSAPMFRFTLIQLADRSWQFIWSFHHILLDGWSTSLIIRDVFTHYDALCDGSHPSLKSIRPYSDYITWLSEQDQTTAEQFWTKMLSDFSSPTPLPGAISKAKESGFSQQEYFLPETLSAQLKEHAQQNQLTLNTLIQGAWALLLSRYSQEEDLVFGATRSGRPVDLNGVEEMVGLFINTLPVRIKLPPQQKMLDCLQTLQQQQMELQQFEYASLSDVQRWSGIPNGHKLFNSIVVFENYPVDASALSRQALLIEDIQFHEQSNFPLAILVVPGNALRIIAIYQRQHYPESQIKQILDQFQTILTNMIKPENSLVSDISILSKAELQHICIDWNQTDTTAPNETSLHRLIEDQVVLNSDKPAINYDGELLSYGSLNGKANQLARHLNSLDAGKGKFIGILLDRSAEMVIAILGVLKTGATYVPLDADYPQDRLTHIINDAQIKVIVSLSHLHSKLPSPADFQLVSLDSHSQTLESYANSNPDYRVEADTYAYVIYTSGSTGKPKGVLISHHNAVNSTLARGHYYANSIERFLLLSSISFDSSVAGIFWSLCFGATLCIPDKERYKDAEYLADFVHQHRVTHMLCIPALWTHLIEFKGLESLNTVIVAGELCTPSLTQKHFDQLPNTALFNEYGPTEASVWSSVFDCSQVKGSASVPIGRPIDNVKIFILNEQKHPVPIGASGELYIGGQGVSDGYLNQPELTSERFIEAPTFLKTLGQNGSLYRTGDIGRFLPDGNIEFLGRRDQQVKLRGYRIELSEIEVNLNQHPKIEQSYVVLKGGDQNTEATSSPIEPDNTLALAEKLFSLDADVAQKILVEIENKPIMESTIDHPIEQTHQTAMAGESEVVETPDFKFTLAFKKDGFISPPRNIQRRWLVHQMMSEIRADLNYLDEAAKTFVPGKDTQLESYDISERELNKGEIMEDWQTPLMKAMAKQVTNSQSDVLEIGFGRGVSSQFIQDLQPKSHTIIEANPFSIKNHYQAWRTKYPNRDIRMVEGMWQDVIENLGCFDGLFFHTFPLNEEEFIEYVMNSITFAEHFFPVAAKLLRPGGAFTYLTTEIDSLSRRHQRALFRYFSSFSLTVEPVQVPQDTADTWWAESMIIIKAVK